MEIASALDRDNTSPYVRRFNANQMHFAPVDQPPGQNFVPVWSVVYVTRRGQLLSYEHRRQKIGSERVYRRKALGFPAPVHDDDQTLFDLNNHGVVNRGITTLSMHIGTEKIALSSRQEPIAQVMGFSLVGGRGGPLLLGIVRYEADDWFEGHARSLSVRDLRWIDAEAPLGIDRLDLYSRAVLDHLSTAPETTNPSQLSAQPQSFVFDRN